MTEPATECERPPRSKSRRTPIIIGAIVAIAVIGFAGVYGIGGLMRNGSGDPSCRPALALANKIAPLARGEVAAVTMVESPVRLPDLTFTDHTGAQKQLSDWRGQTVLVNLWATWCVPCRREMPALDNLQNHLGGPGFSVVAINIDTRDFEKPVRFLKDAGLTHLGYFSDPTAKVFQELKRIGLALGMPTSVLIDGAGCEIATIAGPAEWNSDDAVALIQAALKR